LELIPSGFYYGFPQVMGFTNFVWIWLFLNKDKRILEWSLLIVMGWVTVALLSANFGANFSQISISRGTSSYHGVMAFILFVGYVYVIIHNLKAEDEVKNSDSSFDLYWCYCSIILGSGTACFWYKTFGVESYSY